MADVFISYSRKDSDEALGLAERLRSEGMTVWIDQHGIEAAKSWSTEIVNAIESSKAFLLLLSSNSIGSENVVKELSLAFESKRSLIPVALEDVMLPSSFKYPLAGIQRVAYTQHDAITQALVSCGVALTKAVHREERKTLLVMPFEDLSPTQDNQWFADGLSGELIDKLSHVKALKLIDRKTSRDLRTSPLSVIEIAKTLKVRYIVEGSVRKFGEQLKISASLLDAVEGDYLWQESHKGLINDVFELQEQVAERVVKALELRLSQAELAEMRENQTSSPEAYQFFLRAKEEFNKFSMDSMFRAVALINAALEHDPKYVIAHGSLVLLYEQVYRTFDRKEKYLRASVESLNRVKDLAGDSSYWCMLTAHHLNTLGQFEQAEEYAKRGVVASPQLQLAYDTLAQTYEGLRKYMEVIEIRKKQIELKNDASDYWNLFGGYNLLGDETGKIESAKRAIPEFDRYLSLHPEDTHGRAQRSVLLFYSGERERAHSEALVLMREKSITGAGLYNLACLLCWCHDAENAVAALRLATRKIHLEPEMLEHETDFSFALQTEVFQTFLRELKERSN